MTENKYTGKVPVQIGEKECVLFFSWEAIAQLQSKHGEDIIRNIGRVTNPSIIADFLEAGLMELHPDITKEEIMKSSPPIYPTIAALNKALTYTFFGIETPSTEKAEGTEKESKKKTK